MPFDFRFGPFLLCLGSCGPGLGLGSQPLSLDQHLWGKLTFRCRMSQRLIGVFGGLLASATAHQVDGERSPELTDETGQERGQHPLQHIPDALPVHAGKGNAPPGILPRASTRPVIGD